MTAAAITVMTGTGMPNHNADLATNNADGPSYHLTPNTVIEEDLPQ